MKNKPNAFTSGMRGNEKPKTELESIRIEPAENGWTVNVSMREKRSKSGGKSEPCCSYIPPKASVFESRKSMMSFIEKTLGIPDADDKE